MMQGLMALALAAALAGCAPAAILGGGLLGVSVAEQRTTADQLRDTRIKAEIENRLVASSGDLFRRVGVDVFEGRALLTGTVLTQPALEEANRLAATTAGVREVLSEIMVDPQGGGALTLATDVAIANAARARLIGSGAVKTQNYDLRVNHGVLYLIGIAVNAEELNRATGIAAEVKGVRQVVSHLLLIDDPRRKPAA